VDGGSVAYAPAIVRRPLLLLLPVLAATTTAGCGDKPPPPARPPVQLSLSAPRDAGTTREATALVSGSVVPSTARVIVLGERVAVDGGGFSTNVDLREGSNVIDVGASAPGRRAVWRALRVTRRSLIRMPVLVGQEEDAAKAALEDLGLSVQVTNDDDLLDAFRGGPHIVCATNPEAGAQLKAGAEVEVVVSRTC
jgi:hypothetical protein